MADAKAEAEWMANIKAIADEADTKDSADEPPKNPKPDVVVGSEEEKLLIEVSFPHNIFVTDIARLLLQR